MLTNMRGTIMNDPELRTVPGKEDKEVKVVDITLAYQKDAEGGKTSVRCVAWAERAEAVAAMNKGDTLEFAGNLTYNDYQNPTMEKPRKILGFTISAIDNSHSLCEKTEQFLGVERMPNEKPGTVFQAIRGKLLNDPELTRTTKDGAPLDLCHATLRYWNGRTGEGDCFIPITAYGEEAKKLSEMKKGDPIQFVGRLDSRPYTNNKMDYSHMELCYTVVSIDPERKLVRKTEEFLKEQTGLAKRPLNDKINDAETRKGAPEQGSKDESAHDQATPAK